MGSILRRTTVALAITAGMLLVAPPAAHAAARIPSAPCGPGGVKSSDSKIADRLRPAMTGRRLGAAISGRHVACARAIVGHVKDAGLPRRAAVIAVATAIAESTLNNYTVAVDHDSLGLFQQRPSTGWGSPAQLVEPRYATYAFLRAMLRKHPAGDWMTGDIGRVAQRVQGSAYPGAYAPEAYDAFLLVEALWERSGGTRSTGSAVKPVAPAAPKPTGPLQRLLHTAATGIGAIDARSETFLADWNRDGKADLFVLQREGTATGKTELRIMDGAHDFQPLLLTTATVLGPTDARHEFSLTDWNADGRPDLVVMLKSGTASGATELRIIDGASFFQRFLLETVTILDPTDERHVFTMADWNGDKKPDLVMVQKAGTTSGKTEIRILDGASDFHTQLLQTDTALDTTDDRHDIAVADWTGDRRLDLIVVQKSGTASGKAEVQIVNGATYFQTVTLRAATGQGPADDRHELTVTDWNGDGKLELAAVQKSGTASGRTEVRILG